MPDVYLSRSDLALVDAGIRALQAAQEPSSRAARFNDDLVERKGLTVELSPVSESVLLEVGEEVAKWKEYAEAAVAVVTAAVAVYKAVKSGAEWQDERLREQLAVGSRLSLDELIEARNELERDLFTAGG